MRRTIRMVLALLLLPAAIVTAQQEETPITTEARRMVDVAQGKTVLSCPGCDLKGVDYSGLNLSKANLARADLQNANLSNTKLDDADFSGANLLGANFEGMTCARCNFSDAQLDRNALKGAKLDNADLQFTDAAPAMLKGPEEETDPNEPWACGYSDLSKVRKRVHVSTKGKDEDTCGGTPETACLTIAKGIAVCKATPDGCAVLVGYGEYQLKDSLQLATGIDLHGGCVGQSKAKKEYVSLIRAAQDYTAVLSNSNGAKTIQGFQIFGSDGRLPSSFSLAVYVADRLTILNSHIVAGNGAKATDAGAAGAGQKGGNGSEQNGGTNPTAPPACQNGNGGKGGSTRWVSVSFSFPTITCHPRCDGSCDGAKGSPGDATGGDGGGKGGDNCAECPARSAGTGIIGNTGTNGGCGVGGTPGALPMGSIIAGYWRSEVSAEGQTGKTGGGGGGGGAGGYFAGWCFGVTTERSGGRGGGGGAGGCGGYSGAGGHQGGASIGILVSGGQLTIRDSRITAGRGGDGGKGGDGAKGGAGGNGAAGGSGDGSAGTGGAGGSGGWGGSSGGGGGGNGGPSIGIAIASGTTDPVESNVIYYIGAPGDPGKGGKGGASTVTGGCTGGDGQDGKPSSAVEKHKF